MLMHCAEPVRGGVNLAIWPARRLLRLDVGEPYDAFRLAAKVRKIDADIYHGQAQHAFGCAAIRLVGKLKRPLVSTAHGSMWGLMQSHIPLTPQNRLITLNMERGAFNFSDRVICVSNSTRNELIRGYAVEPDRIHVINNGVDPDRFLGKTEAKHRLRHSENDFVVTFVAKGTPRKGGNTSLRILKKLAPKLSHEKNLVVQVIVDEKSLLAFSPSFSLRQWKLCEAPTSSSLTALLSASDAFVFPTRYEAGSSFLILEAMAARNVVLTSDIPPNTETIESGISGYILDPADEEAWVTRILDLYSNRREARTIQENALKRVNDNFHVKSMCRKTLALYESTLRR